MEGSTLLMGPLLGTKSGISAMMAMSSLVWSFAPVSPMDSGFLKYQSANVSLLWPLQLPPLNGINISRFAVVLAGASHRSLYV